MSDITKCDSYYKEKHNWWGAALFAWFMDIQRESLFSENGSLTLINSSLTLLSNVFKLLCSKDKFVLPAHIVGAYTLEESGRLFRCEI